MYKNNITWIIYVLRQTLLNSKLNYIGPVDDTIKLSVSDIKIREYIETCIKSFIFYKQKEKNIFYPFFCTIKMYNVFISICHFLHFVQCVPNVSTK